MTGTAFALEERRPLGRLGGVGNVAGGAERRCSRDRIRLRNCACASSEIRGYVKLSFWDAISTYPDEIRVDGIEPHVVGNGRDLLGVMTNGREFGISTDESLR